MSHSSHSGNYERDGYVETRGLFELQELHEVLEVLERFHSKWLLENQEHYQNGVVNSAYITSREKLSEHDRLVLFKFIGSEKIARVLEPVLPDGAMFINTQLFFNPHMASQKNYWHRDGQYNNLSIDEQKASLRTSRPLHVRVALRPERGVELVPGSHYEWDSEEEFEVRMARNSREVFDDLSRGRAIAMAAGDVLLFSANMIHRGLYGGDRFAFDLLFSNVDEQFASFADYACLPSEEQLNALEWPDAFAATARLKSRPVDREV